MSHVLIVFSQQIAQALNVGAMLVIYESSTISIDLGIQEAQWINWLVNPY